MPQAGSWLCSLLALAASACGSGGQTDASVPIDARSCGGERLPCCTSTPWCNSGFACVDGSCRRPPLHCNVSGIADPATLIAAFDSHPSNDCTDVPPELLDPTTPGSFPANTIDIGRIDCVGLSPTAPATIEFHGSVRLLQPGRHVPGNCHCGTATRVIMQLVVEGGATTSLTPDGGQAPTDFSCRSGPDFRFPVVAPVDSSGRLSARVDLLDCTREEASTCLFLRGTGIMVSQ